MSRILKIVVLIVVAVVLFQSCKSPTLDFEWFLFEAEGSYSAVDNKSYIKLNAWVEINQSSVNINQNSATDASHFQFASVNSWIYRVYSGEQLVFEISNFSLQQVLGHVHLNVATNQFEYAWVAIVSEDPITGDIFKGMNPDSAEVQMLIYDDSGNEYLVSNRVPFHFSRN